MRLVKSVVLGIAVFGAFGAGLGVLVRILSPLVSLLGWPATLYILGMLGLLGVIIAKIFHLSP